MKKVLIVIDYQYDFVAEDGLLTAGEPVRFIENEINCRIEKYLQDKQDIIFTLDTHFEDGWEEHPESKSFSLHCKKGTKGQELFGKIKKLKEENNLLTLEKRAYCIENKYLEEIVQKYDEIELIGVVTDICVFQIGIGLYNTAVNLNKKIKFRVYEKACASFEKNNHNFVIDYMKNILKFEII